MKCLLAGIALASAASLAAPAAAEPFVGPRVEAVAGLDQLNFDLARYGVSYNETESGLLGGLAVGYDVPLRGNLIAGLEAGVTFSGIDYRFSEDGVGHLLEPRRDLELSARLGTRITGNALAYVKAGYSNLRLRDETSADGIRSRESYNLDGARVGAGIEVALMPNAYLKSEYRYTAYEDDIESSQVVTGIGLRF